MSTWDSIKSITSKVLFKTLPAVAKVASMVLGAIFVVDSFSGWSQHEQNEQKEYDGLETSPGKVLAIFTVTSVAIVNIVTRYFNMMRDRHHGHSKATWLSPGVETTKSLKAGYLFSQGMSVTYMGFTGINGFLCAFSLLKLLSKISSQIDANIKCENEEAVAWEIASAHALAVLLGFAAISSFHKYNLERVREYYDELFIKGEWRNVSSISYVSSFFSVGINTVYGIFSIQTTLDKLRDNSLCRIPSVGNDIPHYDDVTFGLMFLSILSNIVVNGIMTVASTHKHTLIDNEDQLTEEVIINAAQPIEELPTKRAELLEKLPAFKRWNWLILASIWGNSILNNGLGTVVSFALLPSKIKREQDYLAYNVGMIALGTAGALFASYAQLGLDHEGYIKEMQARLREQHAKQKMLLQDAKQESDVRAPKITHLVNNPALKQPLISERDDDEVKRSNSDDVLIQMPLAPASLELPRRAANTASPKPTDRFFSSHSPMLLFTQNSSRRSVSPLSLHQSSVVIEVIDDNAHTINNAR
jgi:hypothetical protein